MTDKHVYFEILRVLAFAVAWVSFILVIVILFSLGDCAPGVKNCGVVDRKIALTTLAVGAAGLVYFIARAIRVILRARR